MSLSAVRSRLAARGAPVLLRVVLAWAVSLGGGCPEWLEVDDGEEEAEEVPDEAPFVLPAAPAIAAGEGPFVPQTPGLRVPLAGYWARARLDSLDMLFPYAWISVQPAEQRLVLRLEAVLGQTDSGYGLGPSLRAVIPMALPHGTDESVIKDGFAVTGEVLTAAVVGLRTSSSDLWQVQLTRLELSQVTPRLIIGTLEGEARRGARGQRGRRFQAGFVALRAEGPAARGDRASPTVAPPPAGDDAPR